MAIRRQGLVAGDHHAILPDDDFVDEASGPVEDLAHDAHYIETPSGTDTFSVARRGPPML